MNAPDPSPLLLPSGTAWRRPTAGRAAVLIDGQVYFRALRTALKHARHQVIILAWELHTKVTLDRDRPVTEDGRADDGWPVALLPMLLEALERNPDLHIHVVLWRAAVLFRLERELPFDAARAWDVHPRLHFREDGDLPALASHHQKVVVVDDRVAFAGGMDIAPTRWDTPGHRAGDPRRYNPDGSVSGPYHDLQMVVDGDAARALGDLARGRWARAAGEILEPPPQPDSASPDSPGRDSWPDPWPDRVEPDFRDVVVAIARTEHPTKTTAGVREVEQGILQAIAGARRWIYVEQQYLTSHAVAAALGKRLEEDDGPEVVIVLPEGSDGAAQQAVMDVARDKVIADLRARDAYGRFGVFWPEARGVDADGATVRQPVYVHAKAMVVDGRMLRVGSANFANRSMGLDTECDLAIEVAPDTPEAARIDLIARTLVGNLLGVPAERVAEARNACGGSLLRAISVLREESVGDETTGNTLVAFTHHAPALLAELSPDLRITDPDRPIDADTAAALLLEDDAEALQASAAASKAARTSDLEAAADEMTPGTGRRAWMILGGCVAVLAALILAWSFTPLHQWVDPQAIVSRLAGWADEPMAPVIAAGLFVVLGLTGFPVLVMVLTSGLLFDPGIAVLVNFAGVIGSAVTLFGIGRLVGRQAVERFGGRAIPALSRRLARSGAATVAALRNLPVAPFTVVNLVCGSTHIRFRDYLLGTVLGMAPGILALSLFGDQVADLFEDPSLGGIAMALGLAVGTAGIAHVLQRWAERRDESGDERDPPAGAPVEEGTPAQ